MYKKKYRIIQDKNGVKKYNHLNDWKEIFQPKEKPDYLKIGDMPEWYQLLVKCIEDKNKKDSKKKKVII